MSLFRDLGRLVTPGEVMLGDFQASVIKEDAASTCSLKTSPLVP